MPYPREQAKMKHDLLGIYPVNHENEIISECLMEDYEKFSNKVQNFKSSKSLICHNYSYEDSPNPPLPKRIEIIGYIKQSTFQSILNCMNSHKCTIAVRNSNWKDEKDRKLCKHFSILSMQCNDHDLCGILLPDGDRIGVFKYFNDEYYACECYVMDLDDFKNAFRNGDNGMSNGVNDAVVENDNIWQPVTEENNDSNEVWQPVKEDNGSNEVWQPNAEEEQSSNLWQPVEEENPSNLWQPPGQEENNAEEENSSSLWQPPGQEENNASEGLWQPPSTSDFEPSNNENIFSINNDSRKRPRSPSPSTLPQEEQQFHKDNAAAAADEFYSNLTRSMDTRADSRLFHMRAFNGWVKATQIMELDPQTSSQKLRIMDLACGKGGDLGKWILQKRGIANYVGIDVARGSLKDAALRIQRLKKGKKTVSIPKASLICADLGEDVPSRKKDKLLTWTMNQASLQEKDPVFHALPGGNVSPEDRFDVISIQFAIHYMMKTKERARRFFKTVGDTLDLGGNMIATTIDARVVIDHIMNLGYDFWDAHSLDDTVTISVGDGACQLTFQKDVIRRLFSRDNEEETKFGLEYFFSLSEGSDHAAGVGHAVSLPEWLIPISVLQELAEEAGLEMEACENFHEFYSNRKNPSQHPQPHNALYNMHVLNKDGSISSDNWEISRMYVALKFTKIMDCEMLLDDDEMEFDDVDEEEVINDMEDEVEEDVEVNVEEPKPIKVDAMKMILGMKKAKALYGELWNSFTPEQKDELSMDELRKMS